MSGLLSIELKGLKLGQNFVAVFPLCVDGTFFQPLKWFGFFLLFADFGVQGHCASDNVSSTTSIFSSFLPNEKDGT